MRIHYMLWGILASALVLGLGGCVTAKIFATPTVTPTPAGPRQIVENTLRLREYWRVPHTCLDDRAPGLAAATGRVACLYLYHDSASTKRIIQVFDTASGALLWEKSGEPSSGLENVHVDDKRLYFQTIFEIQAYDLDNGQQLWDRSVPIKGGYFHLDGEKLNLLESRGGPWMLYSFDVDTGDMLSSESVSTNDDFIRLATYPQFDLYFGLTASSSAHQTLRVVDRATQKVLWQIKVPELISLPNWPPVLLDDVLLIDLGEKVIAFDAQSGRVLWEQGGGSGSIDSLFATRAVLMSGSLYALRFDGRLLRFDPKTGVETGYIQFMPHLPTYSPRDKFFSLATDGQMLFVSFDDSQELIALGP